MQIRHQHVSSQSVTPHFHAGIKFISILYITGVYVCSKKIGTKLYTNTQGNTLIIKILVMVITCVILSFITYVRLVTTEYIRAVN